MGAVFRATGDVVLATMADAALVTMPDAVVVIMAGGVVPRVCPRRGDGVEMGNWLLVGSSIDGSNTCGAM